MIFALKWSHFGPAFCPSTLKIDIFPKMFFLSFDYVYLYNRFGISFGRGQNIVPKNANHEKVKRRCRYTLNSDQDSGIPTPPPALTGLKELSGSEFQSRLLES